jgi:hypothetical protein
MRCALATLFSSRWANKYWRGRPPPAAQQFRSCLPTGDGEPPRSRDHQTDSRAGAGLRDEKDPARMR